jgi:hypothetical protein
LVTITAALLESIEALERLDIPITDVKTISDLRQALLEEFGIPDVSEINLTTKSLQSMLKTSQFVQRELIPLGVTPFRVEYPSGKAITRFGITGMSGSWGAEAVNEYLASLED